MGLENVRKGLVQEAQSEGRKIASQAEKQAEQILDEAKQRASAIKSEAKQRAQKMSQSEYSERTSAAQLKAKKLVAEALNRKMDEALAKAWEEFVKVSQGKDYEKMLKNIITQAEKELGGKTVVHVNADDAKIAKKYSKNVSAKPANISGGAIVSTPDGRISINSSLEALFDQSRDDARKELYAQMMKGRET